MNCPKIRIQSWLSGKYSEQEQAKRLQKFEELRFEDVHFRYTENGPWVLQGVSFKVKKGDRVAIVGATGSGKSTIVRVLIGLHPYQGSITIKWSGAERHFTQTSAKYDCSDAAGIILFEESISFNIALNRPEVSLDKIREASRYVYANSFIEQLPEEYDFKLLEGGKNVSEGQGRLIVFARAPGWRK